MFHPLYYGKKLLQKYSFVFSSGKIINILIENAGGSLGISQPKNPGIKMATFVNCRMKFGINSQLQLSEPPQRAQQLLQFLSMGVRAIQTNALFVIAIAVSLLVLGQRSSSVSHTLCPEPASHTIVLSLARL